MNKNSSHGNLLQDCINLIEWMKLYKISDLKHSNTELLKYAALYLQSWNKQTNIQGDQCLIGAHDLAFEFFRKNPDWAIVTDWLLYFKILLFLGQYQRAIEVIAIILKKSENDYDYPNYLFYAGVAHKAYQDFDMANNYFFEATQLGPPKFFNNIEMMTIISRNLEDLENDDSDRDDAYRMVFMIFYAVNISFCKNLICRFILI
jgi:tetratricopeptide (TPR) repeat protein